MAIVFSSLSLSLSLIKLIQHELCVRTVSLSVLRSEQGDRGQFIASESDCVQVQVHYLRPFVTGQSVHVSLCSIVVQSI